MTLEMTASRRFLVSPLLLVARMKPAPRCRGRELRLL